LKDKYFYGFAGWERDSKS